MDALSSFSRSSYMDVDFSMLMDTDQEFEPSQGGVVRWVASQSTNPALQALIREAEHDRRTRPSTPVDEPMSWTYTFTSTTSSTPLSTSVASAWHASGHSSVDAPYPPPPSGSSSSTSSSSLATRASEPSVSRRPGSVSTAQRRPLASSTSSANQPPRRPARLRSSSHSTQSNPSVSQEKYAPQDDEPEALHFMELLKEMSKQVDENSKVKQQVIRAKGKGKKREESLERGHAEGRIDLGANNLNARALSKTMSASAVCPVNSSTRAREKTLTTSMSAHKPNSRGRALAKEPSFGARSVNSLPGKSTPTSHPNPNLNRDLKPLTASRRPAAASSTSNASHATRRTGLPGRTPNTGDRVMQDVIDPTETDTDQETPISGLVLRADTTMCMDLDDEDEENDTGMDVSFYKPEPLPRTRVPAPKPKPQPSQPTQPPAPAAAPTQRTRTGPPPLGMRRAPQLQPSQYSSTQGSRGVTVPPFKPPLLVNVGGSTDKSGSRTKPTTAPSSRSAPPAKAPVAEASRGATKDPDSSFDVSFDLDADALEEAMKAYD